nr:zinc finger, CCHC-type [Tanacetum cinerariifolium]
MGDENLIHTLRDYFKPTHEGMNTIKLPVGNNVGKNTPAFISISLRDQASNGLEHLPAGSITTWEDLTTHFLAQFFPPRRTIKFRNDILVFQQHNGEFLSEAWTCFKDLLQKVPHRGIDLWLQALIDFDAHQEKRLSSLRTQLEQQQDDMISKINLLWEAVTKNLDDAPLCDTTGSPIAQMNFASTDYHTKEELQRKGIKSPSKLLSLKYLCQSSIIEQNKNPVSPKHVYFVNSIVILNKENEAEKEGSVEPNKLITQATKMKMKLMKKLKAKRKLRRKLKERPKKKKKITQNTLTPFSL